MPSGSAALSLLMALLSRLMALCLRLARSLSRRGLEGRVARWHGSARAHRSAGSPSLPRHAFAGRAFAGRAEVAERAFAGRADMAGSRALARRHRVAGPRRLSRSHGITGWHGRRRLAAGGVRRPAGTAWAHPWLVARTRRLTSSPAGRRPVLAPAAWPALPAWAGAPGVGGGPAVRRISGDVLAARHPGARDHPWARRAGRRASRRSSASARAAGPNALRRRARRDRCPRSERQPGAGSGRPPWT